MDPSIIFQSVLTLFLVIIAYYIKTVSDNSKAQVELVKEQLAQKDATIEHLKLNFEAHQNIYDPGTELKKLSIEDSLA